MKKSGILLALVVLLAINLQNCQTCDDCQVTPPAKEVKVVNSSGDNLIFGASAVYNPDNIVIKNNLGETIEFFTNTSNGTIDFGFTITADIYSIKLNASNTETIKFTYGKDKNIDCCNEFDVTKTTTVNGKLVSNDDNITIVK